MRLLNVLTDVPGIDLNGNPAEEISGITFSSSAVRSGYIFAALKGEKADGYDFIEEAAAKGAVAVISERGKPASHLLNWIQAEDARLALALCSANFYEHPSRNLQTVGITGTKGKTTISYLLEAILIAAGFDPGVIGTIFYSGPGLEKSSGRTTPEAPDLQRMMRTMQENGGTHCVMEISSHSLELKRVNGIDFDVNIFTNLSGDHLDYHKSMDNYYAAKKKLFLFSPRSKAVVNIDDQYGKKLAKELNNEVVTFGFQPGAQVCADKFSFSSKGITMTIKHQGGSDIFYSPLLGRPNIYNILAAFAAASCLEIPLPVIKSGIASLQNVRGRFEKIENQLGLNIFVDYAHADDPLRNLLETARELCKGKIILVFGAGGDRDRSKRARMGRIAGSLADWTIITSDNPRSEDPMKIIAEIEKGMQETGAGKFVIQPDRRTAIQQALEIAQKNDHVLVAGKGHEDYQIIKDKVFHFDDAEVIREILKIKENK